MIVLDTHAWLWWLHEPARLSSRARTAIEEAEASRSLRVSTISVWEVAIKVASGKLALPMDLDTWFGRAQSYPGIELVSVDARDALESTRLPGSFHRDPADRLIVALARRHGAPLVTRDQRIRDYGHVTSIW